jgi:formate-dependent nitrite reductase membrane component NrfD
VAEAWLNVWGVLLLAVVALGMVAPLVIFWRGRSARSENVWTGAALVLIAGYLLRVVIVFSSESV